MSESTWLPNLVGGTSIWKLAVDLNETKFFDGRLLVPETEGSESLPVTVRWDLTGLVPLKEAREKFPGDVGTAMIDFQSALERVAKVFATPNSGFDKYKDAFTVPSPDADDGANYFYSPSQRKLLVINWGASPRSMGGKAEYVFGYEDWGKHWSVSRASAPSAVMRAGVGAAAAGGAAALAAGAVNAAEKTPAKKEEKKKNDKARPWWIWPLFGLIAIALVLLALFLLKACEEQKVAAGADASDAPAEGSSTDAANGQPLTSGGDSGAAGHDAGDAGTSGDASADARADAAGGDASADGGKDAGKDGSASNDDDDDDFPEGPGGGAGGAGGAGSSGGAVVKIGPGGGQKTSVHRKHYTDDAVKWRVATGAHKVSRTEEQGHRFDVWLAPGQSFEGVRVEWQDKAGKWHVH